MLPRARRLIPRAGASGSRLPILSRFPIKNNALQTASAFFVFWLLTA